MDSTTKSDEEPKRPTPPQTSNEVILEPLQRSEEPMNASATEVPTSSGIADSTVDFDTDLEKILYTASNIDEAELSEKPLIIDETHVDETTTEKIEPNIDPTDANVTMDTISCVETQSTVATTLQSAPSVEGSVIVENIKFTPKKTGQHQAPHTQNTSSLSHNITSRRKQSKASARRRRQAHVDTKRKQNLLENETETKPSNVSSADESTNQSSTKDEEPKDVEPKDEEPKDVEIKEVEPKDEEPKDVEPQDVEPKDVEPQDVEPKWHTTDSNGYSPEIVPNTLPREFESISYLICSEPKPGATLGQPKDMKDFISIDLTDDDFGDDCSAEQPMPDRNMESNVPVEEILHNIYAPSVTTATVTATSNVPTNTIPTTITASTSTASSSAASTSAASTSAASTSAASTSAASTSAASTSAASTSAAANYESLTDKQNDIVYSL